MLRDRIQQLIEQSGDKIPDSKKKVMTAATQTVANSLSIRQIPKVGDFLPEFEMSDSNGRMHSSLKLVGERQLILTFFRGGW